MVNIRFLEDKDIPKLANLYLKLRRHTMNVGGTQEMMINYINQRLPKKGYFIYVATVNDILVGTIAFEIKTKKSAAISDAYIEPEYRRQGILKELEQSVIENLKAKGVETLDLVVRVNNEVGKATWSALGYKTIMEVRTKSIKD
ncbi:MAG: GNAT family N-acetyltransferase [Promethearchaeota archaeon]